MSPSAASSGVATAGHDIEDPHSSKNRAAIGGATASLAVLLLMTTAMILWWLKRKRRAKKQGAYHLGSINLFTCRNYSQRVLIQFRSHGTTWKSLQVQIHTITRPRL